MLAPGTAAIWYDFGMTTKIAVSLPDQLVAEARTAVTQGRADSVSGYIARAMAEHGRQESLAALLDDLDSELGPPGKRTEAWADKQLDRRSRHAGAVTLSARPGPRE